MNTELETYFDNYADLFNSEGFKQLVSELSNNATQLADIQTVKDQEDLYFRKGQVAAFATSRSRTRRACKCLKYLTFVVQTDMSLKNL